MNTLTHHLSYMNPHPLHVRIQIKESKLLLFNVGLLC